MTTEEKQLLLIDLCARLPYGVKVETPYNRCYYNSARVICIVNRASGTKGIEYIDIVTDNATYPIKYAKPYLRPMSSMTEEEKCYIDNRWGVDNYGDIITYSSYESGMSTVELADIIGFQDWLNAHHFDYRGLIERGLAIAVTDENNPYKE